MGGLSLLYIQKLLICVAVLTEVVLSQTTAGLTCASLKIPTWLGIDYNLTSPSAAWELHYSCEFGYQFKDYDKDDENSAVSKTSYCTLEGWNPSVEVCIPTAFKDLDPIYAEPVEAKNSRIIGTAAIIFLICECLILFMLDIPIWKRVFCREIPTIVKKHWGVRNVMHVAAAASKFKSKKRRRQSEMPMLTKREMMAKKLIL